MRKALPEPHGSTLRLLNLQRQEVHGWVVTRHDLCCPHLFGRGARTELRCPVSAVVVSIDPTSHSFAGHAIANLQTERTRAADSSFLPEGDPLHLTCQTSRDELCDLNVSTAGAANRTRQGRTDFVRSNLENTFSTLREATIFGRNQEGFTVDQTGPKSLRTFLFRQRGSRPHQGVRVPCPNGTFCEEQRELLTWCRSPSTPLREEAAHPRHGSRTSRDGDWRPPSLR